MGVERQQKLVIGSEFDLGTGRINPIYKRTLRSPRVRLLPSAGGKFWIIFMFGSLYQTHSTHDLILPEPLCPTIQQT